MTNYDPEQDAWPAVQSVMTMRETAVKSYPTFVNALGEVVENGYWREFVYKPQGKVKRFDTFADFLAYVEVEERDLLALLQAHNEDRLLARVRAELGGDLAAQGRPAGKGSDTTFGSKDRNATYVTARLRRDHAELYNKVMDGEMSVNEAAIKAGIRRRYLRIPADDVQAAVAKLVDEFGEDTVRDALVELVAA